MKVVLIDLQQLTILVTADASWATETDLKSQSAYMVCATAKAMRGGKITPVTPLKWKNQKQERAGSSTRAAELFTVSNGPPWKSRTCLMLSVHSESTNCHACHSPGCVKFMRTTKDHGRRHVTT